jgi:AI-2 transport protein TqsA
VQFEELARPLVLFGVLQAIGMFVGNVVQPRMQGHSLNIDPIALLLALAFWSVVWGLPGAFLSTPLTTVMMVILAQFHGTHWVAVLLSADGDPGQLKHQPVEAPSAAGPAKPAPKRRSKNLRSGT